MEKDEMKEWKCSKFLAWTAEFLIQDQINVLISSAITATEGDCMHGVQS